jgi:AcrR family transcriptional regulator
MSRVFGTKACTSEMDSGPHAKTLPPPSSPQPPVDEGGPGPTGVSAWLAGLEGVAAPRYHRRAVTGRGRRYHRVVSDALRERKTKQTRARIAKTALKLFARQGYAATSFDDIAAAADVGRRTIVDHFPTKEAILFDHLVVSQDVAIQRLRDRPGGEPAIVSLYVTMRQLCEEGYDRDYLAQIRAVLKSEPRLAYGQLSIGIRAFEKGLLAALESRLGPLESTLEVRALTLMVLAWVDAANRVYLFEGKRSLVEYFDEVVATSVLACGADLKASLEHD